MSLSGLNNTQFPLTLDGTTSLDLSSLTIDGANVDLSSLVPYTGANQTIDAGSQAIRTTHVPAVNADVINKLAFDTAINNLVISVAGTFLDKVTTTPQTVIGNVSYTAQLSSDNLVVPEAKEADLGGVVQVSGNYRRSENDAGVTANYRFGSITSSLGVYQATTTGNFATLGLATVTVGKRYKLNINVLGELASYTSSIQLYASIDGQNPTQSLGPSAGFTPSSTIFQLLTGTFVPQYQYIILLCINAAPSGVGLTVKWFGLEVYSTGVELENVTLPLLTASKVPILNSNKQLVASGTDASKLDYLDNVGSDIQTQLNSKLNLSGSNANQNIVIGAYKVQSTATPSVGDDYTNKTYVDTAITGLASTYAKLAGPQTFTGTHTFSSAIPINLSGLTAYSVLITDGSKNIQTSSITSTELSYLYGVTGVVQTQLNNLSANFANYLPLTGGTLSGNLTVGGASGVSLTNVATTNGFLSTRFYVGARGDNQDDVVGDNKYGPWYGLGESGIMGFTGVPCLAGYAGVALRTKDGILAMTEDGAIGIGTKDLIGRFTIANLGGADFFTLQNAIRSNGQYINQRFAFGSVATTSNAYIQCVLNTGFTTDLVFYVDGGTGVTERLRVRGDGNIVATASVGIGTTSIDTELYVYGKGKFHNGTVGAPTNGVNGGDGTRLVLWPGTSTSPPYALGIDGYTLWYGTPATASHKWYNGTTNVMTLNSGGNLIMNDRLLNVVGGTAYAVPNNNMAAGSLTLGGTDRNYGGGTNYWNSSTAGLLFECQTNTEIAIHDAGDRVASFMYYLGNKFYLGRSMGWGTSNIEAAGIFNTYSNTANSNGGSHIYVSNQGAGDSYAIMYVSALGGACYWFMNGSGRSADGGALTATLRNDNGDLRLQSSGAKGITISASSGDVNVATKLTVGGANDPNGVFNIRNPDASYTHFGYSASWNYIRGVRTVFDTVLQLNQTSYINDWLRLTNTNTGIYWEYLGRGINSPEAASNSYGTISTWGTGRNGWSGYGLMDRYCLMKDNNGNTWGIHDNIHSWIMRGDGLYDRKVYIAGNAVLISRNWDIFMVHMNLENTGSGYFYVNQGAGYGIASDSRIKQNIEEISSAKSYAFIKGLKPSSFCMKNTCPTKQKTADGQDVEYEESEFCCCAQEGFIAQNVLESAIQANISKHVCNHWYEYEEEMKKTVEEQTLTDKNTLGVNDRPILSHTVNAVKGMMEQIDVLTERNKMLEAWARDAEAKTRKMEERMEKMASLIAQLIPK